MSLIENYLMEDIQDVVEQRDKLLKVCMNIQNSTREGDFLQNKQYIEDIHGSLQILMALNAKKTHRDFFTHSEHLRRNWF